MSIILKNHLNLTAILWFYWLKVIRIYSVAHFRRKWNYYPLNGFKLNIRDVGFNRMSHFYGDKSFRSIICCYQIFDQVRKYSLPRHSFLSPKLKYIPKWRSYDASLTFFKFKRYIKNTEKILIEMIF